MRLFFALLILFLNSCVDRKVEDENPTIDSDTVQVSRPDTAVKLSPADSSQSYGNARFRNVSVKKVGRDSFNIRGEGQIFEASFNWVVEDGHNELKTGYSTTDAGAPAWGKFDFNIAVAKARPNSVSILILFETSAEDGRRTHELPIPLP